MNGYAEYLFLLSPSENVKKEITRYKKASAKLIGDYKSMNSPAHISVEHLTRQKVFLTDPAIVRLEKNLNSMPPVLLQTDDFRYFTHLHGKMTIYAHIRSTPITEAWFKLLKKNISNKKAIVPHITVVRDIPEEAFNVLWPHFKHKKIEQKFWVNEIIITRRDTFEREPKWIFFKSFQFKSNTNIELKPAPTIQKTNIIESQDTQIDLF